MNAIHVGVVVISDKASRGVRADGCVAAIKKVIPINDALLSSKCIVPDEVGEIRRAVTQMVDGDKIDLVVAAGGTGLSPRDVTPEAIMPLIEKAIPGIPELMRMKGAVNNTRAILSRSIAGTRGRSIIVTVPGSPLAAAECLSWIWPAVTHGLEVLRGEAHECAKEKSGKL